MSKIGDDLIEGMENAVAHARDQKPRVIHVPVKEEVMKRTQPVAAAPPTKAKLPPIADIEAMMTEWFVEDPTWAKQISDDLWEQLGKSRAGMFDQ
jgi:hypothetical protein